MDKAQCNTANHTCVPHCEKDTDCAGTPETPVCDEASGICVTGCEDADGRRCPEGKVCVFSDPNSQIGSCQDVVADGSGGGTIIYDGCICGVPPGGGANDFGWLVAASTGLAAVWRRRARRFM
jgi:hypothetical protein